MFLNLKCFRSSHQRCSVRKGVLRNFAKFTGKQLCQSLFFNKVAGLKPVTLLKKRFWHKCFPVNFAKFQEHPFYRTPLGDCKISSNIHTCYAFQKPKTNLKKFQNFILGVIRTWCITMFITGLLKSGFPTILLEKQFFRLQMFSLFSVCSVLNSMLLL